MKTVKQLLEEKGTQVWSVAPETTVFQALELMAEKNIGAVVVLDEDRNRLGSCRNGITPAR